VARFGKRNVPGVRHEETAGSLTACGVEIGSRFDGWERVWGPVDCRRCLAVLAEAQRYLVTFEVLQ
jgi:hypothetical protein